MVWVTCRGRRIGRTARGRRWPARSDDDFPKGAIAGLDQDSGHLGSPGASSGHPGLTPSGLNALTTHAAGRDYDQSHIARAPPGKTEGPTGWFCSCRTGFGRVRTHHQRPRILSCRNHTDEWWFSGGIGRLFFQGEIHQTLEYRYQWMDANRRVLMRHWDNAGHIVHGADRAPPT